MEPPWWRRPSTLPLVLAVMALRIVVVGGSIRINDAGESCPEWPTCFGTWHFVVSEDDQAAYWEANPDQIDSRGEDHLYTVFQIFVEWFHRILQRRLVRALRTGQSTTTKHVRRKYVCSPAPSLTSGRHVPHGLKAPKRRGLQADVLSVNRRRR